MSDNARLTTTPTADGGWRILFDQRIGGIPVYTNKALSVTLNRAGQATAIIERRRPLLARSAYPILSPDDAWHLVAEGRWRAYYVDDGAPWRDASIARFEVDSVEIAYVEAEVTASRELVRPYYVFRGTQGYALYVPAVIDADRTQH